MIPSRPGGKPFLLAAFFLSGYTSLNLLFQLITFSRYEENGELLENRELVGFSTGRIPPVEKPVELARARLEEDLAQVINVTCPTDYLGLTDYAREICAAGASEKVCQLFTCRNLLTGTGNDLFYGHARLLMKQRPRNSVTDESFQNMTSDCDRFKKTRGYRLEPVNRVEQEFPIAFNILAHTNAEQVERLLRAIYRPQNVYCIHVDAKASEVFRDALRSIASCFENVRLSSRSERIVYAGYSRLQADITCMKDNMESKIQWRYLINTAAQAYPLRTVTEMVKILKIYNGANDIEGLYGRSVVRQRVDREWIESGYEVTQTGRANPRPPHNIDIVKGSAYGVFSRGFVQFILKDQRAIDLLEWSRKTFSPDEHYWATLHHTYSNPHLHTPGGFSGYPNNKTWLAVYVDWDWQSCRGKMVHNVCVFGLGDLPVIVQRQEFFANKFHQDFEPLGLDCLEAWIRHKENCPVPLHEEFYKNLAFVKKDF